MKDNNDKSFAAFLGHVLSCVLLTCVTACLVSIMLALTIKLMNFIF